MGANYSSEENSQIEENEALNFNPYSKVRYSKRLQEKKIAEIKEQIEYAEKRFFDFKKMESRQI